MAVGVNTACDHVLRAFQRLGEIRKAHDVSLEELLGFETDEPDGAEDVDSVRD